MKLEIVFFVLLSTLLRTELARSEAVGDAFLIAQGIKICNAVPVGPDKFATADHCLGKVKDPLSFSVSYSGQLIPVLQIESFEQDVAFLKIASKVSAYHQIGEFKGGMIPKDLIAKHPRTNTQYKQSIISTPAEASGLYFHNGPIGGGLSGSPVVQDDKVVGIHVGSNGGRGVFVSFKSLSGGRGYSVNQYNNETIPILAAAGAYCSANQPICLGLMGSATTLGAAMIGGVFTYLSSLNSIERSVIQTKLDQCMVDKDQIEIELKQSIQANKDDGNAGISTSSRGEVTIIKPNLEESLSGLPIYDARNERGFDMRCSNGPNGRFVCYLPNSLLSESTFNFIELAKLAYLHYFYIKTGRFPTLSEATEASKYLFSSTPKIAYDLATYVPVQPHPCSFQSCSSGGIPH